MHCHVLGSVLAPAIVVPWILDLRRRGPAGRRGLLIAGAIGLGLLLLSYVPAARPRAAGELLRGPGGAGVPRGRRRAVVDVAAGSFPGRRPAGACLAARRAHHRGARRGDPGRRRRDLCRGLAISRRRRRGRAASGPMVRPHAALDDRRPDRRGERPRHGRPQPPQRPLPRIRRPDRVRHRRAGPRRPRAIATPRPRSRGRRPDAASPGRHRRRCDRRRDRRLQPGPAAATRVA